MKKIFLALSALAALTAVSCVKDELNPKALEPEPEPEIVYDYTKLVLNELYGAGEDNEKFFELYNNGDQDIDLKDVTINKDEELCWTGQKGQVVPAKGYYAIVGAKGTTPDGFSSGFSAKKTVIVELFAPDGSKLDKFQRGEKGKGWGETIDNNKGSWSRIPDGSGAFKMTAEVTQGKANSKDGVVDYDLVDNGEVVPEPNVVLNELYGAGEDNEKFFELYNPSTREVSLKGYTIKKDEELCWTAADDLKIPAGGHYLILGAKGTTPDGFSSGFSAKKTVIVQLFNAAGVNIDTFQRGEKGGGWGETVDNNKGSWSRVPDGSGKFKITPVVTGGKANDGEGATDDPLVKQ